MSSLTLMRGLCLRQKLQGNNEQSPTPLKPSLRLRPRRFTSSAPLPRTLWPLTATEVLVCEQDRAEQARHTWKRGWRRKFLFPHREGNFSGRKKRKTHNATSPLYSGHSINQLWNKSWRGIQRATAEKGKGGYSNFKRREKVGFSLLLLVTPVAALIGKCCVLLCNNPVQSVRWHLPRHTLVKPCPRSSLQLIQQFRRNIERGGKSEIYLLIYTKTGVSWIHLMMCSTCD